MLSPLQIVRVLKHCENIDEQYENLSMAGDEGPQYFDYMRNKGWCEALRLVLESDTKSISNKPLTKESEDD
tara:strand:+ start:151 stop:363 length:213 start_codon:yes stop_codon:yes gene_type:complete